MSAILVQDPNDLAEFERRLAKVKSIAKVLSVIEAVREKQGLPHGSAVRYDDVATGRKINIPLDENLIRSISAVRLTAGGRRQLQHQPGSLL